MRYYSHPVLSGLLLLTFASCSGGGSADATLRVRCAGGQSFCLISCDLGCSQTGCSISEIAENQKLRFVFSDRLAVDSVTNSSISIRTATGVAPAGQFLVSGSELTFKPTVSTVAGVSSFGFQRNETYIITVAGGPSTPFGVKSVTGDRLSSEFTCTVVASRGIADEDQQPPTVEMVSPADVNAAPQDPTIVLRFSELIDTTPLRGALTAASPIRFTLRRATRPTPGTLACDRDSAGIVLEGVPRLSTEVVGDQTVTVVTFKPTVQLPGESCVEVAVLSDLRDLSGRAATSAAFQFFTVPGTPTPLLFSEAFASPLNMDTQLSGGTWLNGARPGQIGGDGRHGRFDPALGGNASATEYTWNTNLVNIPGSLTLDGLPAAVTDGKFYFTDFTLPAGITINFVGPVAPILYVRGKATISGSIKLNGAAMTPHNGRGSNLLGGNFVEGQVGGVPGAFGGRGGNGGRECRGQGPIIETGVDVTNGQNGEDLKLLAGHAYVASAVATGGRGSSLRPAAGDALANTTPILGVYRSNFAPGGTGGGFMLPGSLSTVNPLTNLQIGPVPTVGLQFPLLPFPATPSYQSLNHFVVGGSGGGGGASHAFGTFTNQGDIYLAGAAGSGGGGAFALRAGSDLLVAGSALLEAKGGAGVLIRGNDSNATSNTNWGVTSPGGGGSGGSFLLQSAKDLQVLGPIDTSGGAGSRTGQVFTAAINVTSQAGAGSSGFYRCEAGGNLTVAGTNVPVYNAANNSGPLLDEDSRSGSASRWRSTNLIFPPEWLRYELDVDAQGNGTIVTYTDSGEPNTLVANNPATDPVVVQFQGASVTQSAAEPIEGTIRPWRWRVLGTLGQQGLTGDSATGFRFMLTFNRDLYPNCVVRALRVYARS